MNFRWAVFAALLTTIAGLAWLTQPPRASAQEPLPVTQPETDTSESPHQAASTMQQGSAAWNVEIAGQAGGIVGRLFVKDQYGYVGVGLRFHILDLSTPASPTLVGQSPLFPDFVRNVALADKYAYVATGRGGLRVLNISDPTAPVEVGAVEMNAQRITIADGRGYVVGAGTLYLFDISDPTTPRILGSYTAPDSVISGMDVVEGYVYLAAGSDEENGLYILDVSNPANPREVAYHDGRGQTEGIVVQGEYAYLRGAIYDYRGERSDHVEIVRITKPATPITVGFVNTAETIRDVFAAGDYLFVSQGYNEYRYGEGLYAFDVSHPAAPLQVGFFPIRGIRQVSVAGHHAYLTIAQQGLRVLDVSDPRNLVQIGNLHTAGNAVDVAAIGSHVYVANGAGGMSIVDASNPTTPTLVSTYATSGTVQAIVATTNYAYLATGEAGLQIVDVRNPAQPVEASRHETPGSAMGLAVQGAYAFVAAGAGGLRVFDVSNPSRPQEVGSHPDYAEDVAIAGHHAYLATGSGGLRILNVKNPASPTWVGFFDTGRYALKVVVAGSHAYVADKEGGLYIINIANPSHPTLVSRYETVGWAMDVSVVGSYAYVAEARGWDGYLHIGGGLRILDIRDPAHPVEIGGYGMSTWGVTVAGPYAYVARDRFGLSILDVADPPSFIDVGRYSILGEVGNVVVEEDYAYVVASGECIYYRHCGLHIFNVAEPQRPVELGFLPHQFTDIAVQDHYVYAVGDGFNVIDVSDPSAPTLATSLPRLAHQVEVFGNYAYVVAYDKVYIYDITDPAAPAEIATYVAESVPGAFHIRAITDTRAYLTTSSGLHIIDISNPAAPFEIGSYPVYDLVSGAVEGNYAFLSTRYDGLRILDLSNPSGPTEIGSYKSGSAFWSIVVADNLAYVSRPEGGLEIVDVSNPAEPSLVGFYPTLSTVRALTVEDGLVYLSDYTGGFVILRHRPGDPIRMQTYLPLIQR